MDHDHDHQAPEQPDAAEGPRWHDMGGRLDRLGAPGVDTAQHDYQLWEKRVDALMVLASAKRLMTVDGLRRSLEDMGEQAFESMSYYERWIAAIAENLARAGVFTADELRERMEAVRARCETEGAGYGQAAAPEQDP